MLPVSPLKGSFGRKLAVLLLVLVSLSPAQLLADALQGHLSRYHQGFDADATPEQQRMARLATVSYVAKQGFKSLGVDYQQAKRIYQQLTFHALTERSALVLQPDRINLLTRYLDGALQTEISATGDSEVGLTVKIPF